MLGGGRAARTVLVGLPDAALNEARERCKAAVTAHGHGWPQQLVTLNLAPAALPKAGTHFDLAIAAAVLAASGVVPRAALEGTVLLAELSLDGRLRPVRGLLPALLASRDAGVRRAVVPAQQRGEAALVTGLSVWGLSDVAQLVSLLRGEPVAEQVPEPDEVVAERVEPDLADVVGQLEARWVLEVAAAGGHHVMLQGPPGVGKTLLAERLPGLLPDLDAVTSLEVSAVHSLSGVPLRRLVTRPPYAAPHHSCSVAALVGGGSRIAGPGAVSRAHGGVLFLDEAPEFGTQVLEALRTPLESGEVVLARSLAQTRYPARFQLVLAANPCPCGMVATPGADCRCGSQVVRRYAHRLSGPILDRIDIQHTLPPLRQSLLAVPTSAPEGSAVVAGRVLAARDRAAVRLASLGHRMNAAVPGPVLRRDLPLPADTRMLDDAVRRGLLSARGVDKVLRLAWTLCDLTGQSRPGADHVRAALAMRQGEESAAVMAHG